MIGKERMQDNRYLFLIVLCGFTLWYLQYTFVFTGYDEYTSDAMSYADMARNIVSGRGLTIHDLFPLEITLLKKDEILPFVPGSPEATSGSCGAAVHW